MVTQPRLCEIGELSGPALLDGVCIQDERGKAGLRHRWAPERLEVPHRPSEGIPRMSGWIRQGVRGDSQGASVNRAGRDRMAN